MYHNYSRSRRFQQTIFQDARRFHACPKLSDIILKAQFLSNILQIYQDLLRSPRISNMCQDLKDFIEIPLCCFPCCFFAIVDTNCVGPANKRFSILLPPPDPKVPNIDRQDFCQKILIPYYQHSVSCFLVDIDPISKTSTNVLHGFS